MMDIIYLLAVPAFFLAVGGAVLFFGSDYAQQKWNSDSDK